MTFSIYQWRSVIIVAILIELIVRLVDCRGFASDSVIYGAENADGWPDDSGRSATSLAIALSREQSLSRLPDGRDSDLCAEDFELASATPGRANAKTTDTGDPSGSTSDTGGRAEPSGCSCETGRSAPALWMFVLLALLRRRR